MHRRSGTGMASSGRRRRGYAFPFQTERVPDKAGPRNAENVNREAAGQRTALPGPDVGRDGVPVACGEVAQSVPDARRD